jgi:zinc/manganese transport system permease protein
MIATLVTWHVVATGLSWNLSSDLRQLFEFHFMVNAFRAGTIVAIVAGAMGWFMVLRRQTFAGHTLALTAFPGAAGAIWLGLNATIGYFAAPTASALVIASVPRSVATQTHSQESAVIGTVQAFALACGVLFVTLYKGFLNSLTDLLFGTFLGITDGQVTTLLVVGVAVLIVLWAIGRPLFFASIDPDVAAARGVPVRLLGVSFLLLLGLAVAEASQITGALLVFALLVMPAAAAQQITARPALSLALTIAIALTVTWVGLSVAYFSPYPIGFFVTSFAFGIYVAATVTRRLIDRFGPRGAQPQLVMTR